MRPYGFLGRKTFNVRKTLEGKEVHKGAPRTHGGRRLGREEVWQEVGRLGLTRGCEFSVKQPLGPVLAAG